MQPELNHLVLAYNKTFDEYSLIDLRYNALVGHYITVFNEENPPNIDLENYKKERHYSKEERERVEMLKLMEHLYHVSDRRVIQQEIHKLSKEDLEDFVYLVFEYAAQKPCTGAVAKIALERMEELK